MKKTIIVMPVANEESTMGRILDEILSLPYDNLYIYPVIDSYSKDRTEEIIREREKKSHKVKCIFYQESKGVISCYLEEFMALYEKFPEFDDFDDEFVENEEEWTSKVAFYIDDHIDNFAVIVKS